MSTVNKVEIQLQGLNTMWMSFQQCLVTSETMLKKNKEKFKTSLLQSAEEFKKSVSVLAHSSTSAVNKL